MKSELITVAQPEIYKPSHVESPKYKNSVTGNGLEASSIKGYNSDWEDFCVWCVGNKRQFMPAHPHDVADYLEDRALNPWIGLSGKKKDFKEKQPLKWNTLNRRVTSIVKVHKYFNQDFNRNDLAIKETLDGIKKLLSKDHTHRISENRKDPILTDDINKMVNTLSDTLTGKRDRALLLIGFSGALRRAELASIQKEHINFFNEGIVITLPWSKTGKREVIIPYGSSSNTCPVRSLQDWINSANIESGAVFRSINRHGQIQSKALSCKSVVLIINQNSYILDLVKNAKERKSRDSTVVVPDFGGHSLRAGFVTQTYLSGASEHAIMNQTGHKKSDTLKKYIREADKWKNNASIKLGL